MYDWIYWMILLGIMLLLIAIFNSEIKAVIGEKKVSKILRTLSEDYRILENIMLKTPNGTKQIDHIVLSQYGVFVIEVKNYRGCIYGTDFSEEWTQKLHGETYTFQNPIRKNYRHVKVLEEQLGTAYSNFTPILVLAGSAESKLATNNFVTYTPGLIDIIRGFQKVKFTKAEIIEFENIILTGKADVPETKKYVKV